MDTKVTANRQKKIVIVAGLNEKIGRSKAIIFTNFEKVTHKQLETLKRAIKPMDAEYVVAKNSLVLRALEENKIKLEGENLLDGPTGTLLLYGDVVGPLKQLAKTIKELGLLNVKLGIMENKFLTGEQILKISTLPSREVLLSQIAAGLLSPISGLHRALNWNLQKFVMTLAAVAKAKPASNAASAKSDDLASQPVTIEPASDNAATSDVEPETILAETAEEKAAESNSAQEEVPTVEDEVKSVASNAIDKGGEN
jgi:large subunit ribosomal protein L10